MEPLPTACHDSGSLPVGTRQHYSIPHSRLARCARQESGPRERKDPAQHPENTLGQKHLPGLRITVRVPSLGGRKISCKASDGAQENHFPIARAHGPRAINAREVETQNKARRLMDKKVLFSQGSGTENVHAIPASKNTDYSPLGWITRCPSLN